MQHLDQLSQEGHNMPERQLTLHLYPPFVHLVHSMTIQSLHYPHLIQLRMSREALNLEAEGAGILILWARHLSGIGAQVR